MIGRIFGDLDEKNTCILSTVDFCLFFVLLLL